jgi:hypothetical protein
MAHANEHPTGSKGHHVYNPPAPAKDSLASSGYQKKEYSHQEYPKVVDGVTCKNAEEEKKQIAKRPAPAKAE